ncbi:MAG: tetratricopeptide repeat protein [Pleurocapsa sp. MO_192.B19]|nr:tetratricopeptide repeat protein [Pleurocapsa sp. MO_192.B19]
MEILDSDRQGWFSRGKILASLGKHKAALTCYERAMKIKPNYYKEWIEKGLMLELVRCLAAAEHCFDQALGVFDSKMVNAVEHLPQISIPGQNVASSCYNRACFQALQGNVNQAIAYLQQALNLNDAKYREMSQQDSDFDDIRGHELFQKAIKSCLIVK